MYNNSKVVVVGIHVDDSREIKLITKLNEAIDLVLSENGSPQVEILVKHLSGALLGPSAIPDYPGIFAVPYTPNKNLRYAGVQLTVRAPYVHPANAIKAHQSQGATLPRSVACLSSGSEKYFGMANVATSRTPLPNNFRLASQVTLRRMMPKPCIVRYS